jgi:hypothetical protein
MSKYIGLPELSKTTCSLKLLSKCFVFPNVIICDTTSGKPHCLFKMIWSYLRHRIIFHFILYYNNTTIMMSVHNINRILTIES